LPAWHKTNGFTVFQTLIEGKWVAEQPPPSQNQPTVLRNDPEWSAKPNFRVSFPKANNAAISGNLRKKFDDSPVTLKCVAPPVSTLCIASPAA
jgi:hypothetical protein